MSDHVPEMPEVPEQYTPLDDEPPEADEELALTDAAILSEFPESEDLTPETTVPTALGRSWAFDFARGGFVYGHQVGEEAMGIHSPLETRGIATLRTWIEKCLRTARGAHVVHPEGYGMVQPFDLIGEAIVGAPIADLEQRIRNALMFHPRITGVEHFHADLNPDEEYIAVSFTVRMDDETTLSFAEMRLV